MKGRGEEVKGVWVWGHLGDIGNERVDRLTGEAVERRERGEMEMGDGKRGMERKGWKERDGRGDEVVNSRGKKEPAPWRRSEDHQEAE